MDVAGAVRRNWFYLGGLGFIAGAAAIGISRSDGLLVMTAVAAFSVTARHIQYRELYGPGED